MAGDGLANLWAGSRDQVEDARWQADLVHELGKNECVQRCHLARLEHDGAAGCQRRSHLGGDLVERIVPRRDGTDNPDRLTYNQRVSDRFLPRDLVDDLGHRSEGRDRQADLDDRREVDGRAHLAGDQLTDLGHADAEAFSYTRCVLRPLGRRDPGPSLECGTRRPDRAVDIGGGTTGDRADDLLGGRVENVDCVGARRSDPRAVDIEPVPDLHAASP